MPINRKSEDRVLVKGGRAAFKELVYSTYQRLETQHEKDQKAQVTKSLVPNGSSSSPEQVQTGSRSGLEKVHIGSSSHFEQVQIGSRKGLDRVQVRS